MADLQLQPMTNKPHGNTGALPMSESKKRCDIVYSEDDDNETGKGWYYQDIDTNEVSPRSYADKMGAVRAANRQGYTVYDLMG